MYEFGMAHSVMRYIPSFTKVCQMVQKLFGADTDTDIKLHKPKFLNKTKQVCRPVGTLLIVRSHLSQFQL
jgi:hypothetical protein